jgi:hypothetical protein
MMMTVSPKKPQTIPRKAILKLLLVLMKLLIIKWKLMTKSVSKVKNSYCLRLLKHQALYPKIKNHSNQLKSKLYSHKSKGK